MEDILKQILGEIKGMNSRLDNLEKGQAEFREEINARFDEVEQKQIRTQNAINKLRKEAKALWSENERLLERTGELRQK